ncbi:MAG TPA: 2Fe-2S iron-sulfur cluster-binding protein [Candidatus Obscuribacterales bacterium]
MKRIKIQPLNKDIEVDANESLLKVLLEQEMNVLQACGAQGRCATCHVYIESGMESLSTCTEQERLTLSFIATAKPNSRLACQTRILQNGVVVEVPRGMYVGSIGELKSLIGRRANQNIVHPLTGEVLVEEGKLILRSALEKMAKIDSTLDTSLVEVLSSSVKAKLP